MNIFQSTLDFENWLARRLPVIRQDINLKHELMAKTAFSFFRATFYRWIQLWPQHCSELTKAPRIVAVGDLHIENFGTWRDSEGRLIWGVNDLDEAWPAAYTNDLVRLTASAYLAIAEDHLHNLSKRDSSEAIEEGYRDSIAAGGKAFVLAEHHQWLRLLATSKLRDPVHFWAKMDQNPPYSAKPPDPARRLIELNLPSRGLSYRLKRRVAGLGSLGHPRIVALACWQGALIAREAKGIRTSAWAWHEAAPSDRLYGPALADSAVRVQDPCVAVQGHWLVRRLAPDCSRIELASLPKERDESRLLYDMGWETANLHFGTRRAIANIKKDLARRRGRWLHQAAKSMLKATLDDWAEWRKHWKKRMP